ncbi:MAG: hypothetical protein MZU97_10200 [Bacillus subtilis]|nr:hypothetical protein [Bacillus subtilis]
MTDADVDGAHIRTLLLDVLLPLHEAAHRERLHLHRPAAALQGAGRQDESNTPTTTRNSRRSWRELGGKADRSSATKVSAK